MCYNKDGKPLVVLTGPTAIGKTRLSVELAKRVGGEVLSADSMQVYRHMDIGTAKVSQREMQGVRHYLIDELEPSEEFNAMRFQAMAKRCLANIYGRGKIPIVVGGTGFYIQALLYDVQFTEQEGDADYRKEMENLAKEKGTDFLHEKLREVDGESADNIHPNNVQRVIRALEYHRLTQGKISEHNARERERRSPYAFAYFVLDEDRKTLYERIDQRVDAMMAAGLLEEVSMLRDMGYDKGMVSMQGLGYKELLAHLDGEYTLEEAVRRIKRDTRHFAKRQLTWFRRERDVTWLHKGEYGDEEEILVKMCEIVGTIAGAFGFPNKHD